MSTTNKTIRFAMAEVERIDIGWIFLQWLVARIPVGLLQRTRADLYRTGGVRIGRGTIMAGPIAIMGASNPKRNLSFGERCVVNWPLYLDLSDRVEIGSGVSIGHHVVFVTSNHEVGPPQFRAGELKPAPIVVGDGAWIAARVTILPGVTIGPGAVVAAGSLVSRDVAPNTMVGGNPLRTMRDLNTES